MKTPIKTKKEILNDMPYQRDNDSEKWYSDTDVLRAMEEYRNQSQLSEDQIKEARQKDGFGIQPRDIETCIWMQSHFFQQPVIDKMATTETQEGKEVSVEAELKINGIIDGILNGNIHPYTAKIELMKLFSQQEGKEEPKPKEVTDETILKTACKEYPKWFTSPEDAIQAKAFKKGMETMRDFLTK